MLEAFFVTGVFIPGTLVVEAGGALAQLGAVDFFDVVWFVTIGSILGGEISFWAGGLARRGLNTRWNPAQSAGYRRAERMFARHGGLALVLGRFAGPVSGLVPLAASVAGMDRRRFLIWNIVSSVVYALGHVSFGFFLGDVISRVGPIATRLALFVAAALFLLAVLWWLVMRIERMLPFAMSILRSVAQAIAEDPEVREWAARRPRLAGFIAHRFDTSRFSGLTATLLGAAMLYILFIWAGSALDFLMADPIVQADTRLANLMYAARSPWLVKFFTHVTALGDWRVIASLAAAAVLWLWARRRPELSLGLTVSIAGDVITVAILKWVFHRPRPELAYFAETSGSFPSGHAAIATAFYGMLFYAVWRAGRLGPVVAALLAATLAFLIGLSRLYLIEHFLTDVLNGWLVGTLWLLVGVTVSEWRRGATGPRRVTMGPAASLALAALAMLFVGMAVWRVATYDKMRNALPPPVIDQTVTDIAGLFSSGAAPPATESVLGGALEPVNLLVLASDNTTLSIAMEKAGWLKAERPTLATLARAALAAVSNTEDGRAPVTPYFWRGRPNDFAYQKSTAEKTLRKRHHVRFWRTRYVTPAGLRLFVGAASFDDGLDWRFLHHINPNIDAERDLIARDLSPTSAESLQLSEPRLGESVAGDPWFTDGEAALLTLH